MKTISDVAKQAGVAVSTASRVLSGKANVSASARKKVLKAAKELQYRPNQLAKSLKIGKTNMVALLVPSIENAIIPEITKGIEDIARQSGYTVVLCNTDEDPKVQAEYIRKLRNQWIDGFLVSSMIGDYQMFKELSAEGVPLVLINRFEDDNELDAVGVDNFAGAYRATSYLIKTGNKHIAIAMGSENLRLYRDRLAGYRRALKDFNIPVDEKLIIRQENGVNGFYAQIKEFLDKGNRFDALFATSDPKAFICMHALQDYGIKIPDEVSVVGFDNVYMSATVNPALTTISQPLYEIGAHAMRKLLNQIEAKRNNEDYVMTLELLPTELILRQSTR